MNCDLEWTGLWKGNNPCTVLTVWGKPLRKSRELKTAWFICSFCFSWLSALAFYGIKAEIKPSLLSHGTQPMAQILTLSFAELSWVSERFWGNSCGWTSYRNCTPNLIGLAYPMEEFWYLSFCLYTLYPAPLFYCTGYLIKGSSVSHCEEFLSYFCMLLN